MERDDTSRNEPESMGNDLEAREHPEVVINHPKRCEIGDPTEIYQQDPPNPPNPCLT